jgi:hypothetical protein
VCIKLNANNETLVYVHEVMSHINTAHGRDNKDADKLRCTMKEKKAGEWSIEVCGVHCQFLQYRLPSSTTIHAIQLSSAATASTIRPARASHPPVT